MKIPLCLEYERGRVMADMGVGFMFCWDCEHLNITERQQRQKGLSDFLGEHICKKYKKRILHGKHHPNLPRLEECINDEFKEIMEN